MGKLLSNYETERRCLLGARERLATHRRLGQLNSNDHALLAHAEADFLAALDRTWEAQCMVHVTI